MACKPSYFYMLINLLNKSFEVTKMNYKNIELTLLKALGIIAVVSCHLGINVFNIVGLPLSIKGELFPEYSYHMPLFIFASGYFYKKEYEGKVKGLAVKRLPMLVNYLKCNMFYCILTFILISVGLLNREVEFSLRSLFVEPFLGGFQFYFNGPGWFVLFLFIVQIIYVILRCIIGKKYMFTKYVEGVLLIALMLIGVLFAHISNLYPVLNDKVTLMHSVLRLFYGLQYYGLGYYYKEFIESKLCLSLKTFIILVFSKLLVHITFNYYSFSLRIVKFKGYSILPLIVSIMGILYCLHLVKFILALKGNIRVKVLKLLTIVGENTWGIMMHHLLVKWLLGKIYALHIIPKWLSTVGNYLISPILCIALPVFFSIAYRKFSSKVK